MKEFQEFISANQNQKKSISLARVIKTWGSAPRPAGSVMLVNSTGEMAGSVSGGCVEGAVVKASQEVLDKGIAKKLDYGVSDEDAWSVGLSCGGSIQVFAQPFWSDDDPIWKGLQDSFNTNSGCVLVTKLVDGVHEDSLWMEDGNLIGADLSKELTNKAKEAFDKRINFSEEVGSDTYFFQVFPRKSQLLIVGAAHITVDLVRLGHLYDFETIVIDPRGYFADNTVFAQAPDQLLKKYPSEVLGDIKLDAYTYAAILSHDPKIDDNALQVLLKSDVAYIGALGSRKTHEKRKARLRESGISEEEISRIKAPIGLPINAKSAKEIAFAVMGEILQAKNQFL